MTQAFRPGTESWIASDSPSTSFSAVFEDDRETGYFYAYDRENQDHPILDGVLIYEATDALNASRESVAEITWSRDGWKSGLWINGELQAVIDFTRKTTYCRSNFPAPRGAWKAPSREPWHESLVELLD